jgi:hypothetical protein
MITRNDVVHRVGLVKLLRERSGFTGQDLAAALYGYGSASNRTEVEKRISIWLVSELKKLPRGLAGSMDASPVRRRGFLSRLQISDVAIALLDYYDYRDQMGGWCMSDVEHDAVALRPPTPELIDLLSHLLDVTRHRTAFAKALCDPNRQKFFIAASIDGVAARRGETLSVRRLSELTTASTGAISIWRRSPRYKQFVENVKKGVRSPHPRTPKF